MRYEEKEEMEDGVVVVGSSTSVYRRDDKKESHLGDRAFTVRHQNVLRALFDAAADVSYIGTDEVDGLVGVRLLGGLLLAENIIDLVLLVKLASGKVQAGIGILT